MKGGFVRRADFDDLQWTQKLGLLKTEREQYAETDDERANLDGEIARMEVIVKEQTPRPATATKENEWQRPR